MKNKQKVWIRGVEGRGDEVLNALKAAGGKMGLKPGFSIGGSGEDPNYIYTMTHEGIICAIIANSDFGKIIMDCLREIKLPEPWKDGTVVFSPLNRTFAVCTEKEDTQWGDVLTHFVLSESAIYYNCCIRKRDYRIADKKELKIFSERLHKLGYDFDFKTKEVVKWQWRPKDGETYWIVNNRGFAESYTWYDDVFDQLRFNFGNCFRTKEEAEAAAERVKKALKGEAL